MDYAKFSFGIDYHNGEFTAEDPAGDFVWDPVTLAGIFFHIRLPASFSLRFSYLPLIEYESDDGSGITTIKGSGFKAGVGYTPIRYVTLFVEQLQFEADECESYIPCSIDGDGGVGITYAGVSFPISF